MKGLCSIEIIGKSVTQTSVSGCVCVNYNFPVIPRTVIMTENDVLEEVSLVSPLLLLYRSN